MTAPTTSPRKTAASPHRSPAKKTSQDGTGDTGPGQSGGEGGDSGGRGRSNFWQYKQRQAMAPPNLGQKPLPKGTDTREECMRERVCVCVCRLCGVGVWCLCGVCVVCKSTPALIFLCVLDLRSTKLPWRSQVCGHGRSRLDRTRNGTHTHTHTHTQAHRDRHTETHTHTVSLLLCTGGAADQGPRRDCAEEREQTRGPHCGRN